MVWWAFILFLWGFPGGSEVKASACNAGDPGSILGLGRSPGEGNGNPLQYFWLGNQMNRGAWSATVHGGVAFQAPPGSQASSRGEAKDSALLSSRDAGLLEPPERPHGWRRTRGSLRSSSCLGRKPPRAPQLEETPETPPSSRAEGLLLLHGQESNPGSSLQTEEDAGLP